MKSVIMKNSHVYGSNDLQIVYLLSIIPSVLTHFVTFVLIYLCCSILCIFCFNEVFNVFSLGLLEVKVEGSLEPSVVRTGMGFFDLFDF